MVGTVKTKAKPQRSLAKGQRAVLLPGSNGAEPWEVWAMGGKSSPQMIQACQSPADCRIRKDLTLAIPVAHVYSLPLWLNETDSKQFAGMIPLQLELRGLVPRHEPPVFDWTVVAQEGSRTLVLVAILPASLPAEFQSELYSSFDLAARFLPFPEDALTIWREQDHLAFAITRGPYLVYFQALTENEISTRVLQDFSCARATLGMHDILKPLQRVVSWVSDFSDAELASIADHLSLPVAEQSRPDPIQPGAAWKLTPAVVSESRRKRENSRWIRRGIIALLVLYVLFAGWLVTRLALTQMKVTELNQWKAKYGYSVDLVHQGRTTWTDLAPVVDTKNYPIELLSQAAKLIPTDQLHLTIFEAGEDHLLIKGEAKNVSAAFQFFDSVKNNPAFSSYTLQMDNPRPLPNDLAQFQIQGTLAPTNQ